MTIEECKGVWMRGCAVCGCRDVWCVCMCVSAHSVCVCVCVCVYVHGVCGGGRGVLCALHVCLFVVWCVCVCFRVVSHLPWEERGQGGVFSKCLEY